MVRTSVFFVLALTLVGFSAQAADFRGLESSAEQLTLKIKAEQIEAQQTFDAALADLTSAIDCISNGELRALVYNYGEKFRSSAPGTIEYGFYSKAYKALQTEYSKRHG